MVLTVISKGRQLQNKVESRTVQVVIGVVSQRFVIVVENLQYPLSSSVITARRQGIK